MGHVERQGRLLGDFCQLSIKILRLANKGVTRKEFIDNVLSMLVTFSGCEVAFLFDSGDSWLQWHAAKGSTTEDIQIQKQHIPRDSNDFLYQLMRGELTRDTYTLTESGSYWSNKPIEYEGLRNYGSIFIIPLRSYGHPTGLLVLKNKKRGFFREYEIKFYEGVCQTIGEAFSDRDAQAALRERVKELSCLYSISQLAQHHDVSLKEILMEIVDILPTAFQFPHLAAAKVQFDDEVYLSPQYRSSNKSIKADIIVNGICRGFVEVIYREGKESPLDEKPFLEEEYNLIGGVAKQLTLIIEGKIAEEEQEKLQQQLQHADRLATIGELSAGVAHELNEPLGSILGFSQLIEKHPDLPEQMRHDIAKIERASLHAREIVKKLLIFARQMPTRKTRVDLNEIVKEGLYFLESRCSKEGIELITKLQDDLPPIIGDASQLNQILVNLVVNAIQAMSSGGTLTVSTGRQDSDVLLTVEDTGIGISENIKNQIFLPFFTTKEVGQGTGLGLAVIHGIVSSHGGEITVDSEEGKGTTFRVSFPGHMYAQ
jgi:signal transduction histidine kinase